MSNEQFNFNVEPEAGEIVIRHGEALPIARPEGIRVDGSINAAVEYAGKRSPDPFWTHVKVNRQEASIVMVSKDARPEKERDIIRGSIAAHPHFLELNIDKQAWDDVSRLGDLLRRRKRYFVDKAQGRDLVHALKNFKAKINQEVEKVEDKTAGRFRSAVDKVVSSSLPQTFKLKMPILKGEPPVEFEVEIALDVRDGGVTLWLESPEAEELAENIISTALDSQLDQLQEFCIFEV